jgi:flavin-dependent dehydrogenase
VNPGTLARLRALGVAGEIDARGLRVGGMLVTSARFAVEGRYPPGVCGRAIVRRDLDWILLRHASEAGCAFDPQVRVAGAAVEDGRVVGVRIAGALEHRLAARVTIAADGRRSAVAFGLGLARHPARPRRWAIGAYIDAPAHQFTNPPLLGEMHVRRGCYIGVAPVGHGLANVCLVKPSRPADADLHDPAALLQRTLRSDPHLRERFADARLATTPVVLGPLAVDAAAAVPDGLLLAGDAAGFVDPMTGDGLRFAIRGAELAAEAALEALAHGWPGVQARLAERRRREFAAKQRFNRGIRGLVGSSALVAAAAVGARLAPLVLRRAIAYAGDCDIARGAPAGDAEDAEGL